MPDGYYARVTVSYNRLPEIAAKFPKIVADLQGKAVVDVAAEMAASVPVRTGNLKGSIGSDAKSKAWANADYAAYVNYGTRYMPPRPFVEPAVEKVSQQYFAALERLEALL